VGRFIQGLGAGACAALWRSIFRDTYSGEDLAKYSSYLVIFMMFILPSAPVLGGYLQTFYGWRANFIFMLGYGAIAILGIIFLFGETNKEICPSKVTMSTTKSNYLELLKSPIFMGTAFSVFLSYGTLFCWFVIGPILVIDILNFSPEEFGWMTFCSAFIAYSACACLNSRYVKRFGMSNMLRFGWSVMILSGLVMFFGWLVYSINIWVIAGPIFLFYFGATFIWPNAFAVAFTPFGHIAGYAGALYGFMQVGGASALSGLLAYLPDENQSIFALIIIIASSSAWALYEVVNKMNKSQAVNQKHM
jgi:DHA1 family bicyclomycin/chloramphenicol resistance-like MFS transporter/DHA1 family 2-module integral membrane pump EmrD-like MFS transporter